MGQIHAPVSDTPILPHDFLDSVRVQVQLPNTPENLAKAASSDFVEAKKVIGKRGNFRGAVDLPRAAPARPEVLR